MLDAAYDAYENYRVIRYSGRRPVALFKFGDLTRTSWIEFG